MIKQAPSPGRIAVMVMFALSCVGILLFLWLSFGGPVPLQAKGYRVHVKFPEATQLAEEADVRISGVDVGTVKSKTADRATGLTDAELQLDARYAPLPRDAHAVLRQKTLLGETYVELTPGTRGGPSVADGGTLSPGQVGETVELDEILRTFDPQTRRAFSSLLDEQGRALNGQGRALNTALATLTPFARDADQVLAILDRQEEATRELVRDTGEVFGALSERRGQLRGLVENSNRVFEATAARDRELQAGVVAFPTFLRETRRTVRRVSRFAADTDPLVTQLRPAARQLSPTLEDLAAVSPDLRGFLRDLDPLIRTSRRGLPALERTLDDTRPLLGRLDGTLSSLNPLLSYLGLYKREIAAFFANDSAATQATDQSPASSRPLHYLRTTNPLNPEVLAAYPRRLPTSRSNPYVEPGGYSKLPQGLEVFGSYLCTTGLVPKLPGGLGEVGDLIQRFAFNAGNLVAPPCRAQRPLGRLVETSRLYPRIDRAR